MAGLSRLRGRSPFGAAKARPSKSWFCTAYKTWMPGTRPGMTTLVSVRKSIERCGVADEDAVLDAAIRRPCLKQLEQMACILHLAFDARMRPVAAPYKPLRIGARQRFVERPRIRIVRRVLADAMRARQLCPAPALADRAQQALETIRLGAGARLGSSHVVDHHRQTDRFQSRNRLRQILDVDPELQMPSQLRHDRRQPLRRVKRYTATIVQLPVAEEMIEAERAYAEFIPPSQRSGPHPPITPPDTPQPIRPTPPPIHPP